MSVQLVPGRRRRNILLAIAALAVGLCITGWAAVVRPYQQAQRLQYVAGQVEHGSLELRDGLALIELDGTPAQRGAALGRLCHEPIPDLLRLMGLQPGLLVNGSSETFRATLAAISADDRAEIAAIAAASGVSEHALLAGNALVDAQCSAVVAMAGGDRPLRVARNMDFFPAEVLGPATTLMLVRDPRFRNYVAIGWPGSVSIISGMNDAGLTTCILLNHRSDRVPGGEPLGLRAKRILQRCATVAEAEAEFRRDPVGSGHYLLIADATTAVVLWQQEHGVGRDVPTAGWLVATNGRRISGEATDDRGCHLRTRIGLLGSGVPDPAWMRGVLTASYMPHIAAQAMVFEPATRSLHLALGTALAPAALQPWRAIPLAAWFDGKVLPDIAALPAPAPQLHYQSR